MKLLNELCHREYFFLFAPEAIPVCRSIGTARLVFRTMRLPRPEPYGSWLAMTVFTYSLKKLHRTQSSYAQGFYYKENS